MNSFARFAKAITSSIPEYWQNVSSGAKDLISALLTVDPMKRLDAEQAAANEWIREADDDDLEKKDLGPNLDQLKKFNAKRKFKAAVYGVMASNKLQSLGLGRCCLCGVFVRSECPSGRSDLIFTSIYL